MVVVKTIYKPCPDLAEKLVPRDKADKESVGVRSNGHRRHQSSTTQHGVTGSKSFQWLVTGYKVFLVVSTIFLIASLSMVAFAAILIAERQQGTDSADPMTGDEVTAVRQFYACLPLMFLSMGLAAIQLTIAWIAIMTLRLRFLRTNLYLQLGLLAVAMLRLVMTAGSDQASVRLVVGILVQLVEVCVLQSIIDHVRKQRLHQLH